MSKVAALTAVVGTIIAGLTFYFTAYLPYIQGEAPQSLSVNLTANPTSATLSPNVVLSISLLADVSGGTPPYSYAWYVDGGEAGSSEPLSEELTSYPSLPGVYEYVVRVTDSNGQTASDSAEVNVQE